MSTSVTPSVRQRTRPVSAGALAASYSNTKLASVIEIIPIDTVKPYAGNARKHPQKQIDKLAGIIRKIGFVAPMIVDQNCAVIAGHGRLLAALQLGMTHVPVIRIDYLTPAQVKAFRIAENKLSEMSDWDEELLAIEFKELLSFVDEPDVIDLTAFDTGEIDCVLEIVEKRPKNDPADAIVEPSAGPAISKRGDVWILGRHRLICASSLENESYVALLEGTKVRAVWSDPPYNVKIQGHVSGLGKARHREFEMGAGEMDEGGFIAFLVPYLQLTKDHSMPGALHYSCMDALHSFELLTAARQVGLRLKTTCTWAKTNAGMGSFYRQQTEFVHVFKNGDDSLQHVNNIQLGSMGRYRTTLWTYAGVNTFRRGRQDDLLAHPTVKPWAMVADAIKDCTALGETVLDAFCGSGTTIIAAEKVGRIAFGIELDPLYVDVAVRRWQKATKRSARHADTGKTFDEMETLAVAAEPKL